MPRGTWRSTPSTASRPLKSFVRSFVKMASSGMRSPPLVQDARGRLVGVEFALGDLVHVALEPAAGLVVGHDVLDEAALEEFQEFGLGPAPAALRQLSGLLEELEVLLHRVDELRDAFIVGRHGAQDLWHPF